MACKFFSFLSTKAEVYSSCFSLPHPSFSNSDLFPLSRNFYVLTRATITCVNKTDGPALKWKLSEVQLLRVRATFHTLPYFTYPRKFYTRKQANISRRRKSTLRSIKLNRAISWTFPPLPPPPFHLPLEKGNCVCDVIPSSNVASNANEQEQKKRSK